MCLAIQNVFRDHGACVLFTYPHFNLPLKKVVCHEKDLKADTIVHIEHLTYKQYSCPSDKLCAFGIKTGFEGRFEQQMSVNLPRKASRTS